MKIPYVSRLGGGVTLTQSITAIYMLYIAYLWFSPENTVSHLSENTLQYSGATECFEIKKF